MLSNKRNDLDIIKNEIGDHTIYSTYVSGLKLNKAMLSPFRNERRPSFVVKVRADGSYWHIDYGDDNYKGGSVALVMQLFNLPYHQALRKIVDECHGGTITGAPITKLPEKVKPKEQCVIVAETRPFTILDLEYWEAYGITEQDLIKENIYSVLSFTLDGKEMYKKPMELCFGYKFDKGWKIYFPERTDFKWFSSVPNTEIEGWGNVKHFRRLIITKSRKDRMVLSKLYDNVVNGQNESGSLLSNEYHHLFEHFKEVWVFFDSDDPGVKACKKITEAKGWKYINTPKNLIPLGIKDPAGWVKEQGYEPLKQFMLTKKVY